MFKQPSLATLAPLSLLSAALIPTAPALADGSDVGLIVQNGRLATVAAIGEPPTQAFGDALRTFPVDLEFNALESVVGIEEPGFATQDASVLNQTIGFTLTHALRKWNMGLGTFEATAFTMTAGRADLGLANVTTPTTDVPTPLTPIALFPDDFHYFWTLDQATELTGEGIYLVEGRFTNPGGSLADSLPTFFAFNYGLSEEEHDRSIDWINDNLVPAPGVGLPLMLTLLGLTGARRRRCANPDSPHYSPCGENVAPSIASKLTKSPSAKSRALCRGSSNWQWIGTAASTTMLLVSRSMATTAPCTRRGRPYTGSRYRPPVSTTSTRRACNRMMPITRLPMRSVSLAGSLVSSRCVRYEVLAKPSTA